MAAHQIPAPGGDGVGHQVVDQLDTCASGGLEAEGRRAARQRQVVVDGLRSMRYAQGPPAASDSMDAENAVSSPPIVTSALIPSFSSDSRHACSLQSGSEAFSSRTVGLAREVRLTARPGHGSSTVRDRQRPCLSGPALDEVLEAVHYPDDVPPGVWARSWPRRSRSSSPVRDRPRTGSPASRLHRRGDETIPTTVIPLLRQRSCDPEVDDLRWWRSRGLLVLAAAEDGATDRHLVGSLCAYR